MDRVNLAGLGYRPAPGRKPSGTGRSRKAVSGSMEQRQELLRQALEDMFGSGMAVEILATERKSVVVGVVDTRTGDRDVYRIGYTMDRDGEVTFTTEAEPVRLEQKVVPIPGSSDEDSSLDQAVAGKSRLHQPRPGTGRDAYGFKKPTDARPARDAFGFKEPVGSRTGRQANRDAFGFKIEED